jgi:hypothetical protein
LCFATVRPTLKTEKKWPGFTLQRGFIFDYGALRTPRNCWGRIRTRCLYGRYGVLLGARIFIDFSDWLHHMGVAQSGSKRGVLGRLNGANRSGRAVREVSFRFGSFTSILRFIDHFRSAPISRTFSASVCASVSCQYGP